ncbi:response regulator [Pseudomonas sp. K2I15]|uniref:response regulator n=1 Tax=unclassified Pseudomonas TaxID=196821 RepID=UPI000B4DAFBE|nr:response regulator [Pseudomonas sp. K2I15]OWP71323.1 response regulator [Pseudomonas sp. K2I15]
MRPSVLAGDGPRQQTVPWRAPPAHWQHLSVLVVEDHQAYRALMGWFLQKFGLGYELAGDGQSALSAMSARPFDLVISDCRMPVMDGYSMTREIRRRESADGRLRVPIIALTGKLGPDDARRCLEAGMDDWLPKPLSIEQLRHLLERWLPQPSSVLHGPGTCLPSLSWPTRAELIKTFGDEQVVNRMLHSLRHETEADYAGLVHACRVLNRHAMIECLHRLVGGLAFLGGTGLDARAGHLIEQVRDHGIRLNWRALQQFEQDLKVYLRYLTDL